VIAGTAKSFGTLFKGSRHSKKTYLETLCMLYQIFRLAKTKGDLALESHVEKPEESPIFSAYPTFSKDHHALAFLCDYLRLLTLGTNNANEVETIIEAEIEAHHHELTMVSGAITNIADGTPALGIVAAVLGVIHTMGSISEPPEVLGHLIAARWSEPSPRADFLRLRRPDRSRPGNHLRQRNRILEMHAHRHPRSHAGLCAAGIGGVRAQDSAAPRPAQLPGGRGSGQQRRVRGVVTP
jgi:hypothetical protein